MGYFTQPQQKYAGTGENCNIKSAVIFYPGIKLYENLCASNLIQILSLRAKINFANVLKIVQKSGVVRTNVTITVGIF